MWSKLVFYFGFVQLPNQHLVGKGMRTIIDSKETRKNIFRLQWKLFWAQLRNKHTFLSVFQRTAGLNELNLFPEHFENNI